MRNSKDKDLVEVADYIDDILIDVDDMDFPYCGKSMIVKDKIMFEISGSKANSSVTNLPADKFELTNEVVSIIERCNEYLESVEYKMEIYVRWDNMSNVTHGEYVEGQGGGYLTIQGLRDYIGKEIYYIASEIKKIIKNDI